MANIVKNIDSRLLITPMFVTPHHLLDKSPAQCLLCPLKTRKRRRSECATKRCSCPRPSCVLHVIDREDDF
jgi:hypothetical protein